jgi:hypothetical protein
MVLTATVDGERGAADLGEVAGIQRVREFDGVLSRASLSVWIVIVVPAGIGPLPSRSAVVLAVTSNDTWF